MVEAGYLRIPQLPRVHEGLLPQGEGAYSEHVLQKAVEAVGLFVAELL